MQKFATEALAQAAIDAMYPNGTVIERWDSLDAFGKHVNSTSPSGITSMKINESVSKPNGAQWINLTSDTTLFIPRKNVAEFENGGKLDGGSLRVIKSVNAREIFANGALTGTWEISEEFYASSSSPNTKEVGQANFGG
jgi:hypothetical protein